MDKCPCASFITCLLYNPRTGRFHPHRPSSSLQPSIFQKTGFLSSRWQGWVSDCLPGAPEAGGSGRPPAGARAPESHTAITLANSPRASHASSPQDRPTPRIAPNPRPSWTLHSPPLGQEEDGGTGEEANREPFCYSHLPITQGLGEGGPWKHQILPLGVNSSLHPLSLFPELLKATAWGKPVHTVFSLT